MNLFDHIKKHKWTYSLGAVLVLVAASALTYKGPVYDAAGELSGNVRRMFTREQVVPMKKSAPQETKKDSKIVIPNKVESKDTVYLPPKKADTMLDPGSITLPSKLGDAMIDKPAPVSCTVADWSCTEFSPSFCPYEAQQVRTCSLTNTSCVNPDAVKPAEVESCVPQEITETDFAFVTWGLKDVTADILMAGSSNNLVSKYKFTTAYEDYVVKKMTIVNDVIDPNFGDNIDSSPAVASVTIKYPNESGAIQSKTAPMVNGKAVFSNLDLYVKRGGVGSTLDIYANLSSFAMVGESLSGQEIRLGVQDSDRDASMFEAVGRVSGTVINYYNSDPLGWFNNNSYVVAHTVRKSEPTFAEMNTSHVMLNGENTLLSFSVTANNSGPIALGRIPISVHVLDESTAGFGLKDFKLYRGSTLVSSANIYQVGSVGSSEGRDLSSGSGNVYSDTEWIIVSFDNEEIVSAGSTVNYSLKATAVNADDDDYVLTQLISLDSNQELRRLTAVNSPNTGQIFSAQANPLGGTIALLAPFDYYFRDHLIQGTALIWSDMSADNHQYPTVNDGIVTSETGSPDWTGGYLLDLGDLKGNYLRK